MAKSHASIRILRKLFSSSKKISRQWFVLGMLLMIFLISGISQVAAVSSCTVTKRPKEKYDITVCLDTGTNGPNVSGVVPVTVSVTLSGPGSQPSQLIVNLNGKYLLVDEIAPFYFELPTDYFVDGTYQLAVKAVLRDGFTTDAAIVSLHFNNGQTQPPVNNRTFTPHTPSPSAPGQPLIVMATGDGANGEHPEVTNMIASHNPDMFLYVGDVYETGNYTEFYNWYGTSTRYFGQFRDITNPTVGNHEYISDSQASGYFYYWDNVPHYYSYNASGWHFISIDSTSSFGQLDPGDPQYNWLVNDLSTNNLDCTIIYMHHPAFSIGSHGPTDRVNKLWPMLVQYGVDVVLTGHDHNYQRWHPMDANRTVNAHGATNFVLGAGGKSVRSFDRSDSRVAVGYDSSPQGLGALYMELYPEGMVYRYYNYNNVVLDHGTVPCGSPPGLPQFSSPPVTGTNTARPTIHFTAPEKSTYFQISVAQGSTTIWKNWYPRAEVCGSLQGTQCQLTTPIDLPDGTYDLYLQAWGPGGVTQERGTPGNYVGWQGPVNFTIVTPKTSLPANLAVTFDNIDPIFTWDNDDTASWYHLVVKDLTTGALKVKQWYHKNNSALTCSSTTCTIEPGLTLLNHNYVWWVKSWGTNGFSVGGIDGYAQGNTINFSVLPAPVTPDSLTFQTWGPDFQGNPVPRNYRWTDVQNASWYELVVTNSAKQILYKKWYAHSAICQSNLCTLGPEGAVNTPLVLNGGQYLWSIRAWGAGGFSAWATAVPFNIP